MKLAIGTKVRWENATGICHGTITNIVLEPAANGKITPWIDIDRREFYKLSGVYLNCSVRLCGSDIALKMHRFYPIVA